MAGKTPPLLLILLLLLSTSLPLGTKSQTTPDGEKQILLQIKKDWSDPPALSSWTLSTTLSHCNWIGIECTGGFVTSISLASQNITAAIPQSICDLKSLSYLNLNNNGIPGPFPTSLYECSNLKYLDLSQNLFVGVLPSDIYRMPPRLTDLYVSSNNFTGEIPPSIGRLRAIQDLHLDYNLFNGSIPTELGNLSNLKILWLSNNPFASPSIPPAFGNLMNLQQLEAKQANLVGDIPGTLAKLANLEYLDLSMNSLSGSIPSGIWMLENLRYLYLYDNKLSGEISSTIGTVSLVEIDVSINQLTGTIPEGFGNQQNLKKLLMYFNRLSGEIPASIAKLPALYDLRLFNNSLTGPLPSDLGMHSPLWNVEVDDNRLSGELPEGLCANGAFESLVVFDNNMTGRIPASLGNCSTLGNLQLYHNNFFGDLPDGIWSAVNLTFVRIHGNAFSGVLPAKLPWNLTRLEIQDNRFSGNLPSSGSRLLVFIASNNFFSGKLPSPAELSNIQILHLDGNAITGEIPPEISFLRSLTNLNLSANRLVGEIPASIGSLPVLTSLDLSDNQLSGPIPLHLGNLNLNYLNLSSNQLSGEVPILLQNPAYEHSFLSNPGLCSGNSLLNLRTCGNESDGSDGVSRGLRYVLIVVGALVFLVMATFVFFIIRDYRRRKGAAELTSWKLTSFHSLRFTESSIVHSLTEENLIGSGGAGKVYRVVVGNRRGEAVAVKKIWNSKKLDLKLEKEFNSEVEILGSIRHTNIVKLLCCISSADSKLLVYEFMENGSLYQWLHGRRTTASGPPLPSSGSGGVAMLDWPTRLGIAVGAARGLCYMHHDCSPPIIHRDVKSSNILLDSEFRAKVADFGLARMLVRAGEPDIVSAVAGSIGYMAPECAYTRRVNEKVDVYSFGVVLLELTTGREANDGDEQSSLAEWAWRHVQEGNKVIDALDRDIREAVYVDEMAAIFKLGLVCTGTLPSTRPSMKEVLQILFRYDRSMPGFRDKPRGEHDVAPLLQSINGSRRKKQSDSGEGDDARGLASMV